MLEIFFGMSKDIGSVLGGLLGATGDLLGTLLGRGWGLLGCLAGGLGASWSLL